MKKKSIVLCTALAAVVAASVTVGMNRIGRTNQADDSAPRLSVEYSVKPENVEGKLLSVTVRLNPERLSPEKMLYLSNGSVNSSEPVCTDGNGKKVAASSLNGVWEIGPIPEGTPYVTFSYTVKLGENLSGDTNVNGDMYSDFLAFQGKYVLMLPWLDSKNIEQTEKYVTCVKFSLSDDRQWNAIIPFAEVNGKEKTFQIQSPTWYDFYDMNNSAYCFGSFEPLKAFSEGQEVTFYLDKTLKSTANPNDLNLVTQFYGYYAKAFGKTTACPIVLLRSDENGNTILGGVGGKTTAISLEMPDPDACQIMSRTVYHTFFDSMVTARNLRYQPNLWLYNGLANYYVDASARALPSKLRQIYGIDPQDDMNRKYARYLYFSLEDPGMMAVSPDIEGKMTSVQEEFYYDTKVPLMLSAIEKFSGQDSVVRYLAERGPREDVDVGEMMKTLLGNNEATLRQYFSGSSFLPNYWNFSGDSIDRQQMLEGLSVFENEIADFYQSQNISYSNDELKLIRKNVLESEIKSKGLSFGSQKLESMVRNYSETLYLLLMQNSLRADLCGVKDPGALGAKEKIHTEENTGKWLDYAEKVGYEN